MTNKTIPRYLKALFLSSPVLIFLLILFYWPLATIFSIAFTSSPVEWLAELQSSLFIRFASFTIIQALLTVTLSMAIGLPTGYLLARGRIYVPSILRSAITVPFLFPPLSILLGFIELFGSDGIMVKLFPIINWTPYGFWGIIAAHTLYNISVMARISEGAFATEPANYHEVAKTLGASKFRRFRTITLPHIRPSLEAATLLVFLYAFNSFAMVLVLGQVRLQTIEVMIYAASRIRLNYSRAAILATVQLLMNLCVVYIYSRRRGYSLFEGEQGTIRGKVDRRLATLVVLLVAIVTWAPILQVGLSTASTLNMEGFGAISTLASDRYDLLLGASSPRIIFNTLYFGITVAAFALFFSGLLVASTQFIHNKQRADQIFVLLTVLPMGTSAITISFGLIRTHGQFGFFSRYVYLYIIAAQLIAALPFASRSIFASWQRVPKGLIAVSKTLGADDVRTFTTVLYPYMKSSILVAMLFSFAISIGEFGATFFLARGEWITMSLAIERLIGTRNLHLPNLYALFLVLTALVVFIIIESIGDVELKL